ncbi:MAG: N-acetyltransferase [SAR324 cluster bacterium]|uniref:N-acetyltransferase n=1 Tax=SAR324 cluster bacterium TaxID=2024889 RepID=A0A7X9IJ96_9DELT|nr:N-acetyltransferase [SAR324 cluster bacterium]
MQIRKAKASDGQRIYELVNDYAKKNLMLPRAPLSIYEHIRDFHVSETDGQIVGCSALHLTWLDMGEIRSLAVDESASGQGIGRALVQSNIDEARELGLSQVYAFTYVDKFFAKLGFKTVPHESLPRKVWVDCVNCVKFNCCDEIAMMLEL